MPVNERSCPCPELPKPSEIEKERQTILAYLIMGQRSADFLGLKGAGNERAIDKTLLSQGAKVHQSLEDVHKT